MGIAEYEWVVEGRKRQVRTDQPAVVHVVAEDGWTRGERGEEGSPGDLGGSEGLSSSTEEGSPSTTDDVDGIGASMKASSS